MVNSILGAISKRFSLSEISEKIGVVLTDWISVITQLQSMKELYSTEAGRFYFEKNKNKVKYHNVGEKVHLTILEELTSKKRYLKLTRKLSWLEKLLNKINAAIQGFIDSIKASIYGFFKNLLSKVPFGEQILSVIMIVVSVILFAFTIIAIVIKFFIDLLSHARNLFSPSGIVSFLVYFMVSLVLLVFQLFISLILIVLDPFITKKLDNLLKTSPLLKKIILGFNMDQRYMDGLIILSTDLMQQPAKSSLEKQILGKNFTAIEYIYEIANNTNVSISDTWLWSKIFDYYFVNERVVITFEDDTIAQKLLQEFNK